MEIQRYINKKKQFNDILLSYIENSSDFPEGFQKLLIFLKTQNYHGNREEIENILRLLLNISNNHHRNPCFYLKIEKILNIFEVDIKQTLSNYELFDIFKSNKLILHLLFKKNILAFDENIFNFIKNTNEIKNKKLFQFFIPEMKEFNEKEKNKMIENELLKIDLNILNDFEEKRQKGENDSYICSLIQNDSIEEFITYATKTNLSLTRKIETSIFETNSLLINRKPSLIEYATFCGSIQIFQYLQLNNVELTSSLWIYAIHSKNAELIHLLEENQIEPNDNSYLECFLESIKCHHNDIANYIQNKYLIQNIEYLNEKVIECSFHYYNYFYFPNDIDQNNNNTFFYLCLYHHYNLVNLYIEMKKNEIIKEIKEKQIKTIKLSYCV